MYEGKYLKKVKPVFVFYVSRIWRLFPVFYVFTLLGILSHLLSDRGFFVSAINGTSLYQQIQFIFSNLFLLGYSSGIYRILVPAWSLDVELQFYLLFPVFAFLTHINRKILLFLVPLFLAVAIIGRVGRIDWLVNTSAVYIYLFLLGLIGYYFKVKPNRKIEKISNLTFLTLLACQFFIPTLVRYYNDINSIYSELLSFVLIILAIPFLIRSVHTETNANDKFWGEMSFLIYLSHWVFIIPYNDLIVGLTKFQRLPYVIGFLLCTFVCAYIVYRLIDRPSEGLRQSWVKRQKANSEVL